MVLFMVLFTVPFRVRSRPCPALVSLAVLALLFFAPRLHAQDASPGPIVAPSGRVTTSVAFDGRLLNGGTGWFNRSTSHSGPSRMTIDYGQPHARGREIFGALVPFGEVWRLGANWATSLTLDVNMRIGDLDVPRGLYTLFLLPREDGGVKPIPSWNSSRLLIAYAAFFFNVVVSIFSCRFNASRSLGRCR